MADERPQPMRIRLSEERRSRITNRLRSLIQERLDLDMSEFQLGLLLDLFIQELGAPVYNQAIGDARAFLSEKLADLDGEFYEPEGTQ